MTAKPEVSAMPLQYQIKPDDTVFYLHVPKTAGSTLADILDAKFDSAVIFHSHLLNDLMKLSVHNLAAYRFIHGHFPYTVVNNLLQKRFVGITMLRNPIDRVISQFAHIRRARPNL